MDDNEMAAKQAACLDQFRFYRPIEHACGHVTEFHHNNMALEEKHFAVLVPLNCPWCAALAEGVDADSIEQALKYHGHMRFWGELVAFRRAGYTVQEWLTLQALEFQAGSPDGEA